MLKRVAVTRADLFIGSLFLVLLVTAMQVAGLKIGAQLFAEELFIILVLFLATERIRQ